MGYHGTSPFSRESVPRFRKGREALRPGGRAGTKPALLLPGTWETPASCRGRRRPCGSKEEGAAPVTGDSNCVAKVGALGFFLRERRIPSGAAFLGASPGRVTSEEAGAHRLRCAAEPRGLLSKMALFPRELAFSYSRFSLVGYALRRGALSWSYSTATLASAPATASSSTCAPACGRGAEKVEPGASCCQLQERARLGAQAEVAGLRSRVAGKPSRERQVAALSCGGPWPGGGEFSPEDWDSPNLKKSSRVRTTLYLASTSLFIHLKFATLKRDHKSIPAATCSSNLKKLKYKIKIIPMLSNDGWCIFTKKSVSLRFHFQFKFRQMTSCGLPGLCVCV